MKNLEDQIVDIERLATLRRRARSFRFQAIDALTGHVYVPLPRTGRVRKRASAERAGWAPPDDDVEKALMLRALPRTPVRGDERERNRQQSREGLLKDLALMTVDDCNSTKNRPVGKGGALDDVPVFRASAVLQALAETPGFALSSAALACLHRILQELNEPGGPTWAGGGARAGEHAAPTAFITGECARALLAVERSLLESARAAELLGTAAGREAGTSVAFKVWRDQDEAVRRKSLSVALAALRPRLIVDLPADEPGKMPSSATALLGKLADAMQQNRRASHRPSPGRPPRTTATGSEIPARVITRMLDAVWLKRSDLAIAPAKRGKIIATHLRQAAQVLRECLEPIKHYATAILDRELAAASPHLGLRVDAAELVFAATLLGCLVDWNDPKLKAAFALLQPLVSSNGRLLSILPFDVLRKGYRLNVATLEVTRRLADLMANLDVDPDADFVERLLRPFEETRVKGVDLSETGWAPDPPGRQPRSEWWVTALATDALDSVIHMLDEAINRQVLGQFQHRMPSEITLGLDDLFYPDFGLVAWKASSPDAEASEKKGVAVKLQELRHHASLGEGEGPLFSLVLYGPPGTGKTTLVEALAKSAGAPLVQITPSDILVGGAEAVERRTRHVFQALSKLTHAVILFDEFDPILQDRAKRKPDELPKTVFEFLTPGMLPKLKALYDAAKEQRVSYVLATNFVYDLDPAVIRKGRFDDRHGVYPPDVVSRLGRLLDQINGMKTARTGLGVVNLKDEASRKRVLDAVRATQDGPMDRLARPGWYTIPRGEKDLGETLFGFIVKRSAKPPAAPPEATYEGESTKRQGRPDAASKLESGYWNDWEQITKWDRALNEYQGSTADWQRLYDTVAAGVDSELRR